MRVHLIDGTYELFRYFFALPEHKNAEGEEVSATRGVVGSMLALLEEGATHVGVATDHVVESFRNQLYEGYKTGEGIDPELYAQFPLLEEALRAAGFAVFAMREYEADDGLATAARTAARDRRVEEVLICTPDKDLAQCVGGKVVQLDRRKAKRFDAEAVEAKFGVRPESIPDYLALVGDSADGFPGLPGFGARSSGALLSHYRHLEAIPDDPESWAVKVRGARRLAATLAAHREEAALYKQLATLVDDAPDLGGVDDWAWQGPTDAFEAICQRLDAPRLVERALALAARPPYST